MQMIFYCLLINLFKLLSSHEALLNLLNEPNSRNGIQIDWVVFLFGGSFANIFKQNVMHALQETIPWHKLCNQATQYDKYIYILMNFFICCLSAPQPTLGHCQVSSFTNLMLIIAPLILILTWGSLGTS